MEKMLDYLKQLNLSEFEAKCYISLLETGATTVRDLAKLIGIKRTTAYIYIEQLVNKGLVIKIVKGTQKKVAANSPESLKELVEAKYNSAKQIQDELPAMLKILTEKYPENFGAEDVEIKFYKGRGGVKKIYEEALKAKELRSYVNITIMSDILPENSDLFSAALRNNKEIKIYEIIEDSPISRQQTQLQSQNADNIRYVFKFLPKEVNLSAADTLIYDGKVSIVNVGNKITGVVLNNVDYYNNSKELFDFIWRILPKVNEST